MDCPTTPPYTTALGSSVINFDCCLDSTTVLKAERRAGVVSGFGSGIHDLSNKISGYTWTSQVKQLMAFEGLRKGHSIYFWVSGKVKRIGMFSSAWRTFTGSGLLLLPRSGLHVAKPSNPP